MYTPLGTVCKADYTDIYIHAYSIRDPLLGQVMLSSEKSCFSTNFSGYTGSSPTSSPLAFRLGLGLDFDRVIKLRGWFEKL